MENYIVTVFTISGDELDSRHYVSLLDAIGYLMVNCKAAQSTVLSIMEELDHHRNKHQVKHVKLVVSNSSLVLVVPFKWC